mmetsp:Transcript_21429/g.35469  ORF Transcript_21429/g.35469 Transcript_21429/m.35469 type:complete len:113 (-) Transcript_21429:24-362(-)
MLATTSPAATFDEANRPRPPTLCSVVKQDIDGAKMPLVDAHLEKAISAGSVGCSEKEDASWLLSRILARRMKRNREIEVLLTTVLVMCICLGVVDHFIVFIVSQCGAVGSVM